MGAVRSWQGGNTFSSVSIAGGDDRTFTAAHPAPRQANRTFLVSTHSLGRMSNTPSTPSSSTGRIKHDGTDLSLKGQL